MRVMSASIAEVRAAFGEGVLDENGAVDRKALTENLIASVDACFG